MTNRNTYELQIDGPLLRNQRLLLLRIAEAARNGRDYKPLPGDKDLLEGLLSLTDEIGDQGHDRHGIDCLLADEDDGRCECQKPGFFRSGVPGILAHVKNGRLAPGAAVNRCDLRQRYASDEVAIEKLRELGLVQP